MFGFLSYGTGLAIALLALIAYLRHKDAFHPAVFTAPLMMSGYCFWPLILNRQGDLQFLMGDEPLIRIQTYYLCALISFYVGAVWTRNSRIKLGTDLSPWQSLTKTVSGDRARRTLLILSGILATIALLAYWSTIINVGGFAVAYSTYKGGGYAESGYIGEAYLLSYPAALIFALARQGRGFRVMDWVILITILSPNLLQGTLGVRRGPLFISMATVFVSWVVSRGRVPGIVKMSIGLSVILSSVIFMWSQRTVWFDQDNSSAQSSGLEATLLPELDRLSENDYVSGVGSALVTEYYDGFFWGKRWFVDILVRPIPRQLWPTKYEDTGAYWKESGNPTGFEVDQQLTVLGFFLPEGHSVGVLSDLYSEWWWGGVLVMFLLGRLLRWLWFKHRSIGQVWTALFLAAIGLSIYFPTQSFSAWYQRFLIMAVFTFIAWRWIVGKDVRHRHQSARDESVPERLQY